MVQFEEMYEQRRKEVNKTAEKFEKQLKAAKRSGSKANQDKARPLPPSSAMLLFAVSIHNCKPMVTPCKQDTWSAGGSF